MCDPARVGAGHGEPSGSPRAAGDQFDSAGLPAAGFRLGLGRDGRLHHRPARGTSPHPNDERRGPSNPVDQFDRYSNRPRPGPHRPEPGDAVRQHRHTRPAVRRCGRGASTRSPASGAWGNPCPSSGSSKTSRTETPAALLPSQARERSCSERTICSQERSSPAHAKGSWRIWPGSENSASCCSAAANTCRC
jgi:hypothetical protein